LDREQDTPALPTIINGYDVQAIANIMMPHLTETWEPHLADLGSAPDLDMTEVNRLLADVPTDPDEKLRRTSIDSQ
jgi:hypothetical protein